eukprot:403349923
MIGAFNKLFRNAASLKGKGIFDKRLIKASYSGDMKEPKEKHLLFILECLKGKHLELIRPKEALRKLSDRFFNNLKSLSLMIKALIILHRALQEEDISQTVAHKIKEMENILQPCQNDDQSYDLLKIYQSYYLLVTVMLEKFEEMDLKDSKRAFIIYLNFIKVNREIRKMAAVIVQEFNIKLKVHFYEIDTKVAEALKQSIETKEKKLKKKWKEGGDGSSSLENEKDNILGSPMQDLYKEKLKMEKNEFLTDAKQKRRQTNFNMLEMQGNQGGQMMRSRPFEDEQDGCNFDNVMRTATVEFSQIGQKLQKSSQVQNKPQVKFGESTFQRSVTVGVSQIRALEQQRIQIQQQNNVKTQNSLSGPMYTLQDQENNDFNSANSMQRFSNYADNLLLDDDTPQTQGHTLNSLKLNLKPFKSTDRPREFQTQNSNLKIKEQDYTFGGAQGYNSNRDLKSSPKQKMPYSFMQQQTPTQQYQSQEEEEDDLDAYKTVFQEDPRMANFKASNEDRYKTLFQTATANPKNLNENKKVQNNFIIEEEQPSIIDQPSKESFFCDVAADSFVINQKLSARLSNANQNAVANNNQQNIRDHSNQLGLQFGANQSFLNNSSRVVEQNIFYEISSQKKQTSHYLQKQDQFEEEEFQDAQDLDDINIGVDNFISKQTSKTNNKEQILLELISKKQSNNNLDDSFQSCKDSNDESNYF